MWNYLSNLSPTQLLLLGLGFAMVVYSAKDYFSFGKGDEKPKPKEEEEQTTLTEIVYKWEDLSNECKQANLNEAYELLQKVFPMLVNVGNNRSTKR